MAAVQAGIVQCYILDGQQLVRSVYSTLNGSCNQAVVTQLGNYTCIAGFADTRTVADGKV